MRRATKAPPPARRGLSRAPHRPRRPLAPPPPPLRPARHAGARTAARPPPQQLPRPAPPTRSPFRVSPRSDAERRAHALWVSGAATTAARPRRPRLGAARAPLRARGAASMDLPERSSQGGRLSLFALLSGLKFRRFARLFVSRRPSRPRSHQGNSRGRHSQPAGGRCQAYARAPAAPERAPLGGARSTCGSRARAPHVRARRGPGGGPSGSAYAGRNRPPRSLAPSSVAWPATTLSSQGELTLEREGRGLAHARRVRARRVALGIEEAKHGLLGGRAEEREQLHGADPLAGAGPRQQGRIPGQASATYRTTAAASVTTTSPCTSVGTTPIGFSRT